METLLSKGAGTVPDLIEELNARGVALRADKGVLHVSAPKGVVDAALAGRIRDGKPEILRYLEARDTAQSTDIVRADRSASLPLGFVQQRMWLHGLLEPDTVLYNLPAAWRLHGAMDVQAFSRAFAAVVARHEVLRVSIESTGDEPTQAFLSGRDTALPYEDLSSVPASEREHALDKRLCALRDACIDLETGIPFNAALIRVAPEEHVLSLTPHHVVWDGWSFDIFLRELDEQYAAIMEGRPCNLPPLPIQYADYAVWHRNWLRSGALQQQLAYWSDALSGELAPLELATDLARPPRFTHRGDWEEFSLSAETITRINHLAAAHRGTSFMVLLAAWVAFMHRISGQDEIVVGAPIQARQIPEVTDLIGCFVNTLCLRQRVDPEASFADLVDDVRDTSLGAYEHQDAPIDMLVERLVARRDPSRTPLFQTMFSHQQVSRRPQRIGTLSMSQVHVNPAATPTDLMLAVMEGSSGARAVIHYSTDLFRADTITRMRLRFEHFLSAALADPATSIRALPVATPEERQILLEQWNATTREVPAAATLGGLLSPPAWRSLHAPALTFDGETIEYAELDARINRLAFALRSRHIGRGSLVGLCVERSPQMLVAQMAVLRAGAAYVPLDPAYPRERLAYMAEDARLSLLITESGLADTVPWPRDKSLWLDGDAATILSQSDSALPADATRDARPEDPAYVIYTSGSTGKPKGVAVPHRAVVNFLVSMASEPGLRSTDRLLAVTTLSFDIAVLELLLPLSVGAEIVMASRDQATDGTVLRGLLASRHVTAMQATPATWRVLIEAGWQGGRDFRALVGGEALPPDLAQQLLARCGELWNMYGPTETTVWSTCCRIESLESGISIGRPIANTQVHVLDAHGQLCPVGVPGEIHIGGDGVTLGYLNRPELTAKQFVPDPFAASDGATMYRTGDRGRWRTDGMLEHLGRLDFQVKVRGYRIELGEIESRLSEQAGVARAVVVVREDRPGDVRLVAYVVPEVGQAPDDQVLRMALKAVLPEYMVPQHFVAIDALPLTPNGKIDRKALPALQPKPSQARAQGRPSGAGLDPRVSYLLGIWSQMIGVEVGPEDNFFDIGGHSMLAVQMANRVERDTGFRIKLMRLAVQGAAQVAADLPEAALSSPSGVTKPGGLMGKLRRLFGS